MLFGGVEEMQNNQPIISSNELENFKCHLLFKKDLNRMTILAGENSAGKSSLIQSILLFDTAVKSVNGSVFTLNVHGLNLGKSSGIVSENEGSNDTDITLTISRKENHIKLSVDDNNDASFKIAKNVTEPDFNLFYISAERLGSRAYNNISSASSC